MGQQFGAQLVTRIPTRVGINALEEAFPSLEPGNTISWQALEEAIGEEKESCRFQSVLKAWRKKLLHTDNILMCAVGNNGGLVVAEPRRRIEEASSRVERGRRQVEKAVYIAANTDASQLSAGDADRRDRILSLRRSNEALIKLVSLCGE